MDKKLPKIYASKIDKNFTNNNKVFYSAVSSSLTKDPFNKDVEELSNDSVEELVDKIFKSPNYVYKMAVDIYTKDGRKLHKDIIGKQNNKLITMDDELIPLSDIKNIVY